MQRWILPGIIFLSFLLRVVAIDKYPVGLNPDEASFGYDAYSLLTTGRDQWGNPWPLSLQSFGDYKLPLYSYLAIPSVAIFGLNEFATRLPNALLGVLGVLGVFLMVDEIFKNRKLALVSALFLAISPWHVMLSRGAFEANLATSFIPFGVWLFYKGLQYKKIMVFAALVFGLNLFSYHSARLITPIIVLVLIFLSRDKLKLNTTTLPSMVVKHWISSSTFAVFSIVAGWTMLSSGGARVSDVAIFNPTDRGQSVFERRNTGYILGLPDQISRIFSNKFTFTLDEFAKNYATYFSPQFLFTQGPTERTYGMIPGVGALYLIELVFILTAIWTITKNREWGKWKLLLYWLFLAAIPASLAKGGGYAANRASVMMPVIQIVSSYGLLSLLSCFKTLKQEKLLKFSLFGVIFLSFVFFLENYLYHAPSDSASSMMYGRREMVQELKKIEGQYDKIVVSRSLSEPHIYFAFFNRWGPIDYQNQTQDWIRYKKEGRSFVDQLGQYSLGKYTFGDVKFEENSKISGILLVGKPEEFPKNISPLKTISTPLGKPLVLIVDTSSVSYAKVN